MRPIDVIEGKVSVLDRADVDTDQIIPKQFLKRVERTGFGEFLFYDWIRDGEIELEPNPILVAGPQLRLRLLARARPLGAGGLRLRGDRRARPSPTSSTSNCTKIGLLPVILDEEHCRAVAEAGEARIDVDDQTVTCAAGVFEFEIEPDVKHRLLNGLDDIGITLENAAAIDAFEAAGRRRARPGDDGAVSARWRDEQRPARVGRRRPTTAVSDPAGGVGRWRCSSGSSCAATRRCSTPAAAAGRVTADAARAPARGPRDRASTAPRR